MSSRACRLDGFRILLVEDQPAVSTTLQAYLAELGAEVVTASTGDRALAGVGPGIRFDIGPTTLNNRRPDIFGPSVV